MNERIEFTVEKVRLQKDSRDNTYYIVIDLEPACSFSFRISKKAFFKRKKFIETYYNNQVLK